MASQLSPAQRLAQEKLDAQLLPEPLPAGTDPRIMAAHLRHAIGLLADRGNPSPCSNIAAYLSALFERSVPAADRQRIACRAGCDHCCQQRVQLHPAEAFLIARAIAGRGETIAAIRAAAQQVAPGKFSLPCPMLESGSCSIYEARPLNCHAFASLNVDDCISYFPPLGTQEAGAIRAPKSFSSLRNIVKVMTLTAMRLCGLPQIAYEMTGALAAILAVDNAEQRWLAGEDIFAGAKSYPLSPLADTEVGRMAAYIAPTL